MKEREIINELKKEIKLARFKGITSVLKCPVLPEEKVKKVYLGKLIDRYVKEIFSKYDIMVDIMKEVEYKGIMFSLLPDGYDREEQSIYELKTTMGKIPNDIKEIKKVYLLQVYMYAYFFECFYINLIYINPEEIRLFKITLKELEEMGIKELLDKLIERYKNNEPYIELCDECYYKKYCKYRR
jgi:hypothetical protein